MTDDLVVIIFACLTWCQTFYFWSKYNISSWVILFLQSMKTIGKKGNKVK